MVPDRAGADTRVDVHIGLRDLRALPGASIVEEAWLRARAGEHGYLSGPDAEAVACDALIVPVVTASPDWTVIRQMITLIADFHARHGQQTATGRDGQALPGRPTGETPPQPLPPQAWEALQYALARLAIDFVSGPGALASALRRSLLGAPFNTKSAILDVGYSATIPDAIRRAVILRDQHCSWPGGCDRRPSVSDVHHVRHRKDGGPTSVNDCALLCQYHHDVCIHRWGWKFELLPDGSTRATSPDGRHVIRSHAPPPPPPAPAPPRPSG